MSSFPHTLATVKAMVDGGPGAILLQNILAQTHDDRLEAIQMAVDFACNELQLNKHKKQGLDEDQLAIELCSILKAFGFQVAHDEQIGGHCDIVVKGKELFLWLAEAKMHTAYAWLDQGFKQLSTRYSTGVPGQDNGEVIIYCFNKDAKAMMAKWRQELTSRNPAVTTQASRCGNQLLFLSSHKHDASGLEFHVRHKAVALYWSPNDS
jgi:hypothetical protein